MFRNYLALFSLLCLSTETLAFNCYLTLAKDSCFTNYDVKVIVIDALDNRELTSVVVPKGKAWVRQPFECKPEQTIKYQASFTPAFWKSEENKTYVALRFWNLPKVIKPKQSAWDLPVCFSTQFAEVPLPPDAKSNCQCNFDEIPAVEPKKI